MRVELTAKLTDTHLTLSGPSGVLAGVQLDIMRSDPLVRQAWEQLLGAAVIAAVSAVESSP